MREHVMIGVPTLNYTVSASIAHLVGMSQKMNSMPGQFTFTFCTVEGVKGYALARNNLVMKFLESPCDRLWMIDDDITPTPEAFGLLHVQADIVAPLMPTYKHNTEKDQFNFELSYAAGDFTDLDDPMTEIQPDLTETIADVSMVGTGCTVIRRAVFEDEKMHYDESDLDEGEPPAVFRYHRKSNGGHKKGEDEDFCVRAKKLGYSIKLHTGIEVGHLRFMDLAHVFRMKRHYMEVGVHSKAASLQSA